MSEFCLSQPLPELSRIPGVVLSGAAFSHCLAVLEFLHAYGKLIGLDVPKDIPSLATLQEGLLGLGESQGELQDLLMKLVEAALHDPGLPSYYQVCCCWLLLLLSWIPRYLPLPSSVC